MDIGRLLVVVGLGLALLGGLIMAFGGRLPLGQLPGDLVIRREHLTIWLPIATSILLSVALTAGWWLLTWLGGRR